MTDELHPLILREVLREIPEESVAMAQDAMETVLEPRVEDKPPKKDGRSRAYIFTLWPANREEAIRIRSTLAETVLGNCEYACMGIEVCPHTQKLHIQGYARWKNQRYFNSIRTLLSAGMVTPPYLCGAAGSDSENKTYCSKSGDVIEIGTPSKSRSETREKGQEIQRTVEKIQELAPRELVAKEHPKVYMRLHSGIDKLCSFHSADRKRPLPTIIWCSGPTGSGKSRWAHEFLEKFGPGDSIRISNGFFLGLRAGTRSILLDDFRADQLPFAELLRITDRYKCVVNVKGGHEWVVAEFIIITCIYDPKRCYLGVTEDLTQLERRLTHTLTFPINDKDSCWNHYNLDESDLDFIRAKDPEEKIVSDEEFFTS